MSHPHSLMLGRHASMSDSIYWPKGDRLLCHVRSRHTGCTVQDYLIQVATYSYAKTSCMETLVRIDENQHNYSRDTSQDYLLCTHASTDSVSGYQAFSHSGSNYIKLVSIGYSELSTSYSKRFHLYTTNYIMLANFAKYQASLRYRLLTTGIRHAKNSPTKETVTVVTHSTSNHPPIPVLIWLHTGALTVPNEDFNPVCPT